MQKVLTKIIQAYAQNSKSKDEEIGGINNIIAGEKTNDAILMDDIVAMRKAGKDGECRVENFEVEK